MNDKERLETLTKDLEERINHAEECIRFWEGNKEIQQVWIGIKMELGMLHKRLTVKEGE